MFYVDDAVYCYDISKNATTKLSSFKEKLSYDGFREVYEDDEFSYFACNDEKWNGRLIRLNKKTNEIKELLNDCTRVYSMFYHNKHVYYQRENEIISFNLSDSSKVVKAKDCEALHSKKIYKNNKVYVMYDKVNETDVDKEHEKVLIELN